MGDLVTTPVEARGRLDQLARELGSLSSKLAECERDLEPIQEQYQRFVDDFETGLWFAHETQGSKFPPEAMRLKLAHKAMAPELLGSHYALTNMRKRLLQQMRSKGREIEAQRSILSALKAEMEGSQ